MKKYHLYLFAAAPLFSFANEPFVQCGENLWLHLDFLYMVPKENSIAATNHSSDILDTDNFTNKKAINPDFDWNLGTRFGLGYLFSNYKWDFGIDWTQFHSRAHQKEKAKTMEGMFPIWSLSKDTLPGDYVTETKMHWKLSLDLFDLSFGRSWVWGGFTLRPYLGLRLGWIKQHEKVEYEGGIFVSGPDIVRMKNNYWGIGPRIGLAPTWIWYKGFGIYGDGAIAVTSGQFHLGLKEEYLEHRRYIRHGHRDRLRWMLDAAAGLMWKVLFCQDRFALIFKLGWEYHLFFQQNEWKKDRYGVSPEGRNLQLQGAVFSSRFDF